MNNIKAKEIKLVEIEALKPNSKNPNKHSEEQIERLKKLIEYQGFRNPIVVSNQSGLIVQGHGRLEAAKRLGMKHVPVIFQDFDSEEQEYASIVSDNAISDWSILDFSLINIELPSLGPDFDIEWLGIKDFKIDPDFEKIKEINSCDENSAWVDLPEFSGGSGYIRLTYIFASEEAREKYVKENNIKIDLKKNNAWICYKRDSDEL